MPDAGPVPATDVPSLQPLLYDTAVRPDEREQAAQRLLSRPDIAARNTIRSALSDSAHPSVQQAAARALADRPTPDPTLIDPLLRLLDPQTAEPLLVAAGDALSAFKTDEGVLEQLITRVQSGDERVRAVAARTLGTFVDKRAAAALVSVCAPGSNPPRVATAASAALAYLTGVDPGSVDAAGWKQWWDQNKDKDEARFRSDLAAARSARYDRQRTNFDSFAITMQQMLSDQYKRTPRDQRADTLLGYLRSGDATARTIGCQIAYDAARDGDVSPPEAVREQLRLLVGDAHAEVRRTAAGTLAVINDATAATALLTQLNQENDSRVKAAIADALAPIHDPRAVGPLLALLNDPSVDTAQSAAEAIGQTLVWPGVLDSLRQSDPAVLNQAGEKLRATLLARTTAQNNVGLRNDLVQAIAPLRLPDAGRLYRDMLASRLETPPVRRSLLKAFGMLGDARWVGEVAAWIDDPNDPPTRLAALNALGELKPAFGDYQDSFVRLLDPRQPPEIRDAAWKVLAGLIPSASTQQLGPWEKRLSGDPAKLLVVLRQERDNQRRDGHSREAADKENQIGDLSDQIGQYNDAIAAFKRAYDYADPAQDQSMLRTARIGLTRAYLDNRQYGDAINFVGEQMQRDSSVQGDLGPQIKQAVDRLIERERNYPAATQLIQLALNMKPKLSALYADELHDRLATIDQRSREHNLLPDLPQSPIEQAELHPSARRAV